MRKDVKKLGKPYGECVEDLKTSTSRIYQSMIENKIKYRQKECINLIKQDYMYEKCNCSMEELFNIYNVTFCEISMKECSLNVSKVLSDDVFLNDQAKINSLCPMECDSLEFSYSVSLSSPYTSTYQLLLSKNQKTIHQYEIANGNTTGITLTAEKAAASIARIYINYQELYLTRITELPNYNMITLISNIGGTMGLLLGISLVSLVEIVELIIEFFFSLADKRIHIQL
jgi:hypothetical protein